MIRRRLDALALAGGLLACLSLGACRSSGTAQLTWTGGEAEETVLDSSGVALEGDLELLTTRHERREGRLFVQLELYNDRYGWLPFEWKLDWYDANGFLYDSARGWVPEKLGGRETKTVTAIAPNEAAVSWRFAARRPSVVR